MSSLFHITHVKEWWGDGYSYRISWNLCETRFFFCKYSFVCLLQVCLCSFVKLLNRDGGKNKVRKLVLGIGCCARMEWGRGSDSEAGVTSYSGEMTALAAVLNVVLLSPGHFVVQPVWVDSNELLLFTGEHWCGSGSTAGERQVPELETFHLFLNTNLKMLL